MRNAPLAALAAAALSCATQRATSTPAPGELPTATASSTPTPPEAPPLLQLPGDVRPTRYRLDLVVDPSRDGLEGHAEIAVTLAKARRTIWLHGLGLGVREASIARTGEAPLTGRWTGVNADGLARLDFPAEVGAGAAVIRLAWTAPFGKSSGCFTVAAAGEPYAVTQFEPNHARQAFPGFDEPGFKTPFEVSLTVPAPLVAVSNAPETASEPLPGGRRRVRFAATPPLPTYLVFFGVGPFDVVTPAPLPPNEVRARPLPVRYLAPRGRGAETAFAVAAAADLLPALERYFEIPFPYEKLDQLAVPDVSWAMENAGAILYGDRTLLHDASKPVEATRALASVVTHEVAHQWFGDDVTLGWWTDVWLNESFATWIAERIVSRWRPAWGFDLQALAQAQATMDQDGLASARAVREPLERMSDVAGQFDALSYQKGRAVLAMFERFAGEERFRDGVRAYLLAHAAGTGSTADLLAAVSRTAGKDLAAPFSTFLDRPGVPLVEAKVRCEGGRGSVALRQSRWTPSGSSAPQGALFSVPVCVRYAAGGGAEHERCTLLATRDASLALPEACPAWLLPNAGAAGYYRWTLAPDDLRRLRDAGLGRLSPAERLSLADALRAGRRAGALAYGDAMDGLAALAADPVPEVAAAPMKDLLEARSALLAERAWPAVAEAARRLYRPAFARLGWEAKPGEPTPVTALRGQLAAVLANVGRDPAVRAQAARRGRRYAGVDDGRLHPDAIAPELAGTALAVAVQDGGAPVFDAVLARLADAEDGALRTRLLRALGAADDPALADRALALWRDGRVRPMERGSVVRVALERPESRARAMAWAERELDGFAAALPERAQASLPYAFAPLCGDGDADRVRALLEPRLARWPEMRKATVETLEEIRLCAAQRGAVGDAAARWFEASARGGSRPASGW